MVAWMKWLNFGTVNDLTVGHLEYRNAGTKLATRRDGLFKL